MTTGETVRPLTEIDSRLLETIRLAHYWTNNGYPAQGRDVLRNALAAYGEKVGEKFAYDYAGITSPRNLADIVSKGVKFHRALMSDWAAPRPESSATLKASDVFEKAYMPHWPDIEHISPPIPASSPEAGMDALRCAEPSAWQPIEALPVEVRDAALRSSPRLGDWVNRCQYDYEGNTWVVRFDNPSGCLLGGWKVPKHEQEIKAQPSAAQTIPVPTSQDAVKP